MSLCSPFDYLVVCSPRLHDTGAKRKIQISATDVYLHTGCPTLVRRAEVAWVCSLIADSITFHSANAM